MTDSHSGHLYPVLYSFRRCPYAMRARMAIRSNLIKVELREVDLKNKPAAMLSASGKATVPVLVCVNGQVIDESLDIMHWAIQHGAIQHGAIQKNNTQTWLVPELKKATQSLISHNDTVFKTHLDQYKYADRFPQHSAAYYRSKGEEFLQQLENLLQKNVFLLSQHASLADIALFPFVRQFASVDMPWFESASYPNLHHWLFHWLESELFLSIMHKHAIWTEQQTVKFL